MSPVSHAAAPSVVRLEVPVGFAEPEQVQEVVHVVAKEENVRLLLLIPERVGCIKLDPPCRLMSSQRGGGIIRPLGPPSGRVWPPSSASTT